MQTDNELCPILKKCLRCISFGVYIFLQCTWGILQTTAGLVFYLMSRGCIHDFYNGCIRTKRSDIGGVSLGLFIFVSDNENSGFSEKASVHEFGHTIQSAILGPLYLPLVGLPSALWCSLPFFRRMREKRKISYNSPVFERNANFFGEKLLRKESTKNIL